MAEPTANESFIKDAESLIRSIGAYLESSDGILEALEQEGLDEDALAAISLDSNDIDDEAERYVNDKIDSVPRPELCAAADEDAAQPFLTYYRYTLVEREKTAGGEAIDALERMIATLRNETNATLLASTVEDRWQAVNQALTTAFDPDGVHQQAKIGAFAALALKTRERPGILDYDDAFAKVKNQRRYLQRYILQPWRRLGPIAANPALLIPATPFEPAPPPSGTFDRSGVNLIVDAISRLQEGGSGGLGSSGSTGVTGESSDFGKLLDQQIYRTLGLPNLTSDTAMSTDPAKLVDKLVAGLDRTVLRVEDGESTSFVFSPAQALAVSPLDGGYAVGAQGVVAEAITAHKPTIIRYVTLLEPESCHCSEEEVDDIKEDIERSFDLLTAEARTSVGVFSEWALTLIGRIVTDVDALLDIYGIEHAKSDARCRLVRCLEQHIGFTDDTLSLEDGRTIDRDVGFLTREANDQAVEGIFEELLTITSLLQDLTQFNRGPILVRLRAVIDALPPSVVSARAALNLAGVGEIDRSAFFAAPRPDPKFRGAGPGATDDGDPGITGNNVIDLARLLSWIEACANEWRSRLLDDNLNSRDLSWLQQTLAVQVKTLETVINEDCPVALPDFATVNKSRFALGVRQLREVERHLELALELVKTLRRSITDRVSATRTQRQRIGA